MKIEQCTLLRFEDVHFSFSSLSENVSISWPELNFSPTLSHWHSLTLLHYLDIADGAPIFNRLMPLSGYRDGMVRGGSFDRDAEAIIRSEIGSLEAPLLVARIRALGGEILPSNADLCAKFNFAPRYPLWLKIWFADDEFPASGRLFVDESAPHYLSIEDAVTAGSLILDGLTAAGHWN